MLALATLTVLGADWFRPDRESSTDGGREALDELQRLFRDHVAAS